MNSPHSSGTYGGFEELAAAFGLGGVASSAPLVGVASLRVARRDARR